MPKWPFSLSRCCFLALAAAAVVFFAGEAARAQTPIALVTSPSIRFTVQNPQQLQPVTYSLQISEDGSGVYRGVLGSDPEPVQTVQITIRIHEPLLSKLFDAVRSPHFFEECRPMDGKVAFTGKKTLIYSGPAGAESCTFNYSREKMMNAVAEQLIAVAFTLQEGLRLTRDHRYDPLGLDDELASLQGSFQDHQAIELGNIAPELQSIAQDDDVMNIARRRAQALLAASASER